MTKKVFVFRSNHDQSLSDESSFKLKEDQVSWSFQLASVPIQLGASIMTFTTSGGADQAVKKVNIQEAQKVERNSRHNRRKNPRLLTDTSSS